MPDIPNDQWIDTTQITQILDWVDVRIACQSAIQWLCPDARVHKEFQLEFDMQSGLRKITSSLNGLNGHADKVHCWMLGISSANQVVGQNGETEYVGVGGYNLNLGLDIWGFWGIDLDDPWITGEREQAALIRFFEANKARIMEGNENKDNFGQLQPLYFESFDRDTFADGNIVLVATGRMPFTILELLTV